MIISELPPGAGVLPIAGGGATCSFHRAMANEWSNFSFHVPDDLVANSQIGDWPEPPPPQK